MHLFPSKGHILFHVVQFAAMPVSPPFEISGYGPAQVTILLSRETNDSSTGQLFLTSNYISSIL